MTALAAAEALGSELARLSFDVTSLYVHDGREVVAHLTEAAAAELAALLTAVDR